MDVIVGDRDAVSDKVRQAWDHAERMTEHNTRITLSVAFNYGGRWDMLQAARRAMADGIRPQDLDEDCLSRRMAMHYAPDPDLFIRTGGDLRISNFLLWQLAYTELWFTETLWPDLDATVLRQACDDFASRERRFGLTSAQRVAPELSGDAA